SKVEGNAAALVRPKRTGGVVTDQGIVHDRNNAGKGLAHLAENAPAPANLGLCFVSQVSYHKVILHPPVSGSFDVNSAAEGGPIALDHVAIDQKMRAAREQNRPV